MTPLFPGLLPLCKEYTYRNETQFLPGSGHVDTTVWMHNLDANKTAREEARQQLHKNVASNIEQVQAATPHKKPSRKLSRNYHYPRITKTIQVGRSRHAGHCWRIKGELINDVLLWTPTYGREQDDQRENTYCSYVRIRDVALKTCQRRWTIKRSGVV